ncbi:MAG: hypothetical protein A2804_01095 [Candidatus Pacebacteria bacterium RIFCSPHIGHO2_01_FULL_46_10]|nr:MAG: hypothetical protein A2804_01095 [Candidatus Pacebacteria bacterium RIFCSPHIGHO2_01_FULL_46_10]
MYFIPKTFPYLEITGSYKDVGLAIGKAFKNDIQRAVQKTQQSISRYSTYLEKIDPYYTATRKTFPHLILELEAIATGARVPIKDFFLLNCREIYDPEESFVHCTAVVGFNPDGIILGQNEDWCSGSIDDLYLLKATIGDTSFFGLTYKAEIPGISVNLNNWGLAQCLNDLYQPTRVGVPKNFVARAILECKSLKEVDHLMQTTPHSSGFNHVVAQYNTSINYEVAGDTISQQIIDQVPFVHTNHYLAKDLVKFEKLPTQDSVARHNRAMELTKPVMGLQDIKNILSDTKDTKFPICNSDCTLGSVIVIPSKKEVHICYGHPCAGTYVKYSVDMI